MNFRLTGFLALIAGFLAVLIIFWEEDESSNRSRQESARRAFRFDPARVEQLRVETAGITIECRREGAQWQLVRPLAARANATVIERLLDALQELPRAEILLPPRPSPEAYAPYGLDQPAATLTLVSGSFTNQILIGRRTPLGDGVYVRQADHAGLARLSPALLDLIPADPVRLRDRSLLSGTPAEIQRLDIRTPAGFLQLVRDPANNWRLFQPFSARADPAAIATLLDKLLSCSIVQFVQDSVSDLAPYGLDAATALTAVLNTDAGNGYQMISFGDPLPDSPALCYARLKTESSIYAVPIDAREALRVKPDDLRDRRIPGADPAVLRRVRFEEGNAQLEFQRGGTGDWVLTAPVPIAADPEALAQLWKTWSEVRLLSFESPAALSPPAEFRRTIEIEPLNPAQPTVIVRLGPCPGKPGAACLAIEGETAIALAAPNSLLTLPLDPLSYRTREIIRIPAQDIAGVRLTAEGATVQYDRDPTSDQWVPPSPHLEPLLSCFDPLRAESWLTTDTPAELPDDLRSPWLAIGLRLRGQTGLALTLWIGDEITPGGPRRALLRGRPSLFTLSAETTALLRAPWTPPAK